MVELIASCVQWQCMVERGNIEKKPYNLCSALQPGPLRSCRAARLRSSFDAHIPHRPGACATAPARPGGRGLWTQDGTEATGPPHAPDA